MKNHEEIGYIKFMSIKKIIITIFVTTVIFSGCSKLKTLPMVSAKNPYDVTGTSQVKPVALTKVASKIRRGVKVGSYYVPQTCEIERELKWKSNRTIYMDLDDLDEVFRDEFEASGWKVVGKEENLFEGRDYSGAEILIAAVITKIKSEICMAGWSTDRSKGDLVIHVEWQVYDPYQKNILGKYKSRGSARIEDFEDEAYLILWENAFAMATNNLLANKNFIKIASVSKKKVKK